MHETLGTLTLDLSADARNFDYEFLPVEYFTMEASDGVGSDSRVDVKFAVLDRNEAGSINIKLVSITMWRDRQRFWSLNVFFLQPVSQVTVAENTTFPDDIVFSGIVINSTHLRPDIIVGINWEDTRLFKGEKEIKVQDPSPIDIIKQ